MQSSRISIEILGGAAYEDLIHQRLRSCTGAIRRSKHESCGYSIAERYVIKRPAHVDVSHACHLSTQCLECQRLGVSGGSSRTGQRARNVSNLFSKLIHIDILIK